MLTRSSRPVLPVRHNAGRGAALALFALAALSCSEDAAVVEEPPRPVKLLEIGQGARGGTREYPGTIKAVEESELSFEVPGNVIEIPVKEGQWFERNTVLARLDDRDYRARLDSALAARNNAEADAKRAETLFQKGVLPEADRDQRRASFEVADASYRQARKAVEDTLLRAPFDGRVARKLVEPHESVLAKQRVILFQDDTQLEIRVAIPERDLAGARREPEEVNRALDPRVTVTSIADRAFPAEVREVSAAADPTTRTFEAKLSFHVPEDHRVLTGMTAKVTVTVPPSGDAIRIPATATLGDETGNPYVWVVDRDTMAVRRRAVELGSLAGSEVEIRGGLSPGDLVAVSGVQRLRERMVVRRLEP